MDTGFVICTVMLVRPLRTKARQALMSFTNVDWEEMKNGPSAQVVPLPVPVPGVESWLTGLTCLCIGHSKSSHFSVYA